MDKEKGGKGLDGWKRIDRRGLFADNQGCRNQIPLQGDKGGVRWVGKYLKRR